MRRFEIRTLRQRGRPAQFIVVLQDGFADVFETVVVAPLVLASELPALPRLRPRTSVAGTAYVIAIERLAALDRRSIGEAVADAGELRDEITRALDLLFTGF